MTIIPIIILFLISTWSVFNSLDKKENQKKSKTTIIMLIGFLLIVLIHQFAGWIVVVTTIITPQAILAYNKENLLCENKFDKNKILIEKMLFVSIIIWVLSIIFVWIIS